MIIDFYQTIVDILIILSKYMSFMNNLNRKSAFSLLVTVTLDLRNLYFHIFKYKIKYLNVFFSYSLNVWKEDGPSEWKVFLRKTNFNISLYPNTSILQSKVIQLSVCIFFKRNLL